MLLLVLLSKERTLSVALKRESRLCGISISRAIASNSSTEALGSVISFAFVVYSHHKHSKYLGRELDHGPVASVISIFSGYGPDKGLPNATFKRFTFACHNRNICNMKRAHNFPFTFLF